MTGFMMLTIKTSLVLAIGLLAAWALHRRSAALRHWVLAATLFCGAAIPVIEALTPSWTLPTYAEPARPTDTSVGVTFSPVAHPGTPSSAAQTDPIGSANAKRQRAAAAMLLVWLIGAATNLVLLLIGMSRLTRLRSSRTIADHPAFLEPLEQVSAAFGLRRPVMLVRSHRRAVIVTWGVWKPKVLLPADVDEWPRERLDVVLAHEIAHISRADWLVQTAAEICKAIYWFNPLFWIACARLRYESERACDDAVMNMGVKSHVYATELLELARSFGRHRQAWLPAPAMAARPSNLERRVRAMLNTRLDRGPITRAGRCASVVALVAITLPIATFAQGGFVTFSGTVVDPQDRLLPAATVTVSDARRDVKHETKTDHDGHFELVGLPAGDYTVEAKLAGFRNLTETFALNGQSLDRTLKMQVGELQETITVVGENGMVTPSSQRGNAFAKPANPVCAPGAANEVGGNLRPPRKLKDVRPGYPGVSGNIQLAATIGTDGSVIDVQVVKADRPELAPAAIDAVRQWEFSSTLLNCVPIEVHMNVSVTFRQDQ
jgi:beta-lactamase regulating signal transducer with metallopeptidase domain